MTHMQTYMCLSHVELLTDTYAFLTGKLGRVIALLAVLIVMVTGVRSD